MIFETTINVPTDNLPEGWADRALAAGLTVGGKTTTIEVEVTYVPGYGVEATQWSPAEGEPAEIIKVESPAVRGDLTRALSKAQVFALEGEAERDQREQARGW